jgi:hypothetical protein
MSNPIDDEVDHVQDGKSGSAGKPQSEYLTPEVEADRERTDGEADMPAVRRGIPKHDLPD